MNSRTPPVTIDTIEGEMISSSDTLSLISQHLPIQWDIPDGKIHFIFVNLQKSGSDKTFMKDLVTSPDIPVYKVIYELHMRQTSRFEPAPPCPILSRPLESPEGMLSIPERDSSSLEIQS